MSYTFLFKFGIVLLLSSFMLATAISFLRFRIKKRESDYQRIIKTLGIEENEARFSSRSITEEYAQRDYYLPVAFSTIVCIFGFSALLFGEELVTQNLGKANLLLTGIFEDSQHTDLQQLRWQSMLVLSLAFIGAFVWSMQSIIRRLIAGDLSPNTYYSAALRMIFAAVLSLMLAFLLESLPTQDYTREILPVIAFLTGMLPEQALLYLRERITIFSPRNITSADALPLEMIEGVNIFHRMRLGEVAIDNAQNLAEANIIELLLKTPFNPCQLIDWVAQAKLYLYFKSDIEILRKVGIRTVFDIRAICANTQRLTDISEQTGISDLTLSLVCENLNKDDGVNRLFLFERKLSTMLTPEQKEQTGTIVRNQSIYSAK